LIRRKVNIVKRRSTAPDIFERPRHFNTDGSER